MNQQLDPIHDPTARLTLLTGDDWAPYLQRAIRDSLDSIMLSVYMISHHWRLPTKFGFNLLDELANAAFRGITCRAVIGNPEQRATGREQFNRTAATLLMEAGWKVRQMSGRVLHEKFIVIDRQISILGSHNISRASMASNYDTSLAIHSMQVAERLYRQFWERWRLATPLRPI
jgi:phosphatidylserine/phosphatidylglycerophosphate/cardiolipin synthase-like enzyme